MVRTGDIPYRLSLVASSPFTIMLPRRAIFCSGPQSVFPQEETRLQAQQHKAKLRNARLIPRESVTPVGDEYYSCICSEGFDPGLKAPRFGPVFRGLKPLLPPQPTSATVVPGRVHTILNASTMSAELRIVRQSCRQGRLCGQFLPAFCLIVYSIPWSG